MKLTFVLIGILAVVDVLKSVVVDTVDLTIDFVVNIVDTVGNTVDFVANTVVTVENTVDLVVNTVVTVENTVDFVVNTADTVENTVDFVVDVVVSGIFVNLLRFQPLTYLVSLLLIAHHGPKF